jgi:hypothetical protein
MGRHSKDNPPQNVVTNPVGLNNEGAGPIQDSYTNRAVVDSWNIDAAYEKAKGNKDD